MQMPNGNQDLTALRRDIESHIRARKAARRSKQSLWLLLCHLLLRLMALFVISMTTVLVIALPAMYWNAGGHMAISRDLQKNYSTLSLLVRLKDQISDLERKVDDGVDQLRKEFDEKIEKDWDEIDWKLKILTGALEKLMGEFDEELKNVNFGRNDIERRMADGMGTVDYATRGRVVRHSEPYEAFGRWVWWVHRNTVNAKAENMIRPSFGVLGRCFALKGKSGFIEIRLSAAIVPLAVTLEHVTMGMADDWLNAPKQCRVSGWMLGEDSTDMEIYKKFVLTEFTYDVEKSRAQTFMVDPAPYDLVVDTVRLDFYSNHGNASHTCIYRLRVHGHEQHALS